MRGFDSIDSHKMLHYIIENPRFSQKQMAKELGWTQNEKTSTFVRWLEELRFIEKTGEVGRGKLTYHVPSRVELLNFYSRFRNMKKEMIIEKSIDMKRSDLIKYISKNNGIMCLATSLEFYDDYFRDPIVYAYVTDMELVDKIKSKSEGDTKVKLYSYKYPDKENIEKDIRKTSHSRTIIDLFCNNMAYAAEQFIPKVWNP